MEMFIGSSSEHHPVAKEIKRDLPSFLRGIKISISIWDEWFARGEFNNFSTWDIIQKALDTFDIAIMLLAADDKLECRDDKYVMTRDNVLIEAGAFADAVGIKNVFLLVPPLKDYKMPSDFLGLNYIEFDYARGADNTDVYRRMSEKIIQMSRERGGAFEQEDDTLIKNENPSRIRKGKLL